MENAGERSSADDLPLLFLKLPLSESTHWSIYTIIGQKRGEDGNRVITVRIREEILAKLDRLSAETNHSRNELINLILAHGVNNIEIQ